MRVWWENQDRGEIFSEKKQDQPFQKQKGKSRGLTLFLEFFVQGAGTVALEVERDEFVPDVLYLFDKVVALVQLDEARDVLGEQFDTRDGVVMSHAALPETHFAQQALRLLDHLQRVLRNPSSVGKA